MILAVAARGTPALHRATLSVPPAFAKAFEGEDAELPGYRSPYIIVERLALVAPGTLQTQFYTSAYAAKPDFRPIGLHRFRFPNSHSLPELVNDLHRQLSAMELKNKLVPASIDEKTEFAAIRHSLQDVQSSLLFVQSSLLFYKIFNAMVHHYGAVEITQK